MLSIVLARAALINGRLRELTGEKEGFEMCCGAGFGAGSSVPKLNVVKINAYRPY